MAKQLRSVNYKSKQYIPKFLSFRFFPKIPSVDSLKINLSGFLVSPPSIGVGGHLRCYHSGGVSEVCGEGQGPRVQGLVRFVWGVFPPDAPKLLAAAKKRLTFWLGQSGGNSTSFIFIHPWVHCRFWHGNLSFEGSLWLILQLCPQIIHCGCVLVTSEREVVLLFCVVCNRDFCCYGILSFVKPLTLPFSFFKSNLINQIRTNNQQATNTMTTY